MRTNRSSRSTAPTPSTCRATVHSLDLDPQLGPHPGLLGNLVLYALAQGQPPKFIWKSDTYKPGKGPFRLAMQADGNRYCHCLTNPRLTGAAQVTS